MCKEKNDEFAQTLLSATLYSMDPHLNTFANQRIEERFSTFAFLHTNLKLILSYYLLRLNCQTFATTNEII